MKAVLKIISIGAIACLLTACGTNPPQSKYAITTPNDNLLMSNPVPAPPALPQDYSLYSCTVKESLLTFYVTDLLTVIGKEHADKEGLRVWKKNALETVERLNKGIAP